MTDKEWQTAKSKPMEVQWAVEHEDERYQETLTAALNQALDKQGDGEILTAGETSEWLRDISRRAIG